VSVYDNGLIGCPSLTRFRMDIETDKKIREIISTDLSDRTVIAVAHRIGKRDVTTWMIKCFTNSI